MKNENRFFFISFFRLKYAEENVTKMKMNEFNVLVPSHPSLSADKFLFYFIFLSENRQIKSYKRCTRASIEHWILNTEELSRNQVEINQTKALKNLSSYEIRYDKEFG